MGQSESQIDHDLVKAMKELLDNKMQKLQKQQKKLQDIEKLDYKDDKQRDPSDSEFFD